MDAHFYFDCISTLVTVGWVVIGLLIKQQLAGIALTQEKDKADLVKNQNEVKEALTRSNTATATKLDVHVAEDAQKFGHISETMTRVEGKLDQLAATAARR